MHKVTFYPVGNGDTSQIILENGKRILFDYRHLACGECYRAGLMMAIKAG